MSALRLRDLVRMALPLAFILVLSDLDRQPALHRAEHAWREPAHLAVVLLGALLAAYAVHVGTALVRSAAGHYLDPGHARSAARFVAVLLYGLVVAAALTGLGFNLSGIFVGGALTGIIIGMAAQASLSNVIAGLVLIIVRPYKVGVHVRVVLNGTDYAGMVRDVGLSYTTLLSGAELIRVPNASMIAAVVIVPQPED